MTFIIYLYVIGIILTGLYITAELIIELPKDIQSFKYYRREGKLDADESVTWFVVETLIAATLFSLFFPFFWWLTTRRIKNDRS